VDLAFLEQRTSARGKDYLAGWLGGARVIVTQVGTPEGEPARYVLRLTGKAPEARKPAAPRSALDGPSPCAGERQQPALPLREAHAARPSARHDERPRPQRVRMPALDEIPF
jgi:hypothetical protein